MFKTPTLFIVGAGAGSEIGLPTGAQLKDIAARDLDIRFDDWGSKIISGDKKITQALYQYAKKAGDSNINPYLQEAWAIRDSMSHVSSIDDYLDKHRENEKRKLCGKLAIVNSILKSEKSSALYINNPSDKINFGNIQNTWYSKFFELLHRNVTKSAVENIFKNISLIIFNYDRSLEHFLTHALSNLYDIGTGKAQDIVRSLKIFHPYGTVGELTSSDAVQYGEVGHFSGILPLMEKIKTFTEQIDDKVTLRSMKDEVKKASVIVFLGFGYHEQNLSLLSPDEKTKTERVYGTSKGLSPQDSNLIERKIGGVEFLKRGQAVQIDLVNETCSELLDRYKNHLLSVSG